MRQFTGSAATRVVETDDPINYAYVDGARATNERAPRPSPPGSDLGSNVVSELLGLFEQEAGVIGVFLRCLYQGRGDGLSELGELYRSGLASTRGVTTAWGCRPLSLTGPRRLPASSSTVF